MEYIVKQYVHYNIPNILNAHPAFIEEGASSERAEQRSSMSWKEKHPSPWEQNTWKIRSLNGLCCEKKESLWLVIDGRLLRKYSDGLKLIIINRVINCFQGIFSTTPERSVNYREIKNRQ